MECKNVKRKIWREVLENRRQGTVQDFCSLLGCDDEFVVSTAIVRLVSEGKMEQIGSPKESFREDGGAILQASYGGTPEAIVDNMFTEIAQFDQKYAAKRNLSLEKMKAADSDIRKQIIIKMKR